MNESSSTSSSQGNPVYKILLAEDNDMNRELTTRLLKRRGHQVIAVLDGREAVEGFQEEPFDVILMDMEMPEMDGLEATRRIRGLEQAPQSKWARSGNHIPIIALTAYDEMEMAAKIREAGMDGIITKPIDTKTLDPSIRKIVEHVRSQFKD